MLFAAVLGGAAGALTLRAGASLLRASALPSSRVTMSTVSTALEIEQFGCLTDNYGFLLHDSTTGETAAIDTPEVGPIVEACERRGWTLTHILNTHHHHDHAGGNAELKRRFGCTILGPAAETAKIPTIDTPVQGGDRFTFGAHQIDVLDVGGHTLGHVAYHAADAGVAFVGDSLFALGCGRLFEGTPAQAWASLQRLAALPPDTKVYCAHEYTEANLRFALTVDPGNPALQSRAIEIAELRAAGEPTCALCSGPIFIFPVEPLTRTPIPRDRVPTSIGLELATNPFLRPQSETMRRHLAVPEEESDEATFARIRKMKDNA